MYKLKRTLWKALNIMCELYTTEYKVLVGM